MHLPARAITAIVIAAASAAVTLKGAQMVAFRITDWRTQATQARADAMRVWTSVGGVANVAGGELLSAPLDPSLARERASEGRRLADVADVLAREPLSS
jgi:hypothetical protein